MAVAAEQVELRHTAPAVAGTDNGKTVTETGAATEVKVDVNPFSADALRQRFLAFRDTDGVKAESNRTADKATGNRTEVFTTILTGQVDGENVRVAREQTVRPNDNVKGTGAYPVEKYTISRDTAAGPIGLVITTEMVVKEPGTYQGYEVNKMQGGVIKIGENGLPEKETVGKMKAEEVTRYHLVTPGSDGQPKIMEFNPAAKDFINRGLTADALQILPPAPAAPIRR